MIEHANIDYNDERRTDELKRLCATHLRLAEEFKNSKSCSGRKQYVEHIMKAKYYEDRLKHINDMKNIPDLDNATYPTTSRQETRKEI